jgi:hypothetical protein
MPENYTKKDSSITLSAAVTVKVKKIADAYHTATTKKITITSTRKGTQLI